MSIIPGNDQSGGIGKGRGHADRGGSRRCGDREGPSMPKSLMPLGTQGVLIKHRSRIDDRRGCA